MSDYHETVVNCVTLLAEAFQRTASDATFEAYIIGLQALSPQQVESATHAAIRGSRFMPTPAELRELGGVVRLTDRAERAWMAFDAALSRYGVYKTLLFDDPVVNAVCRSLGGLAAAVELPADEYQSFYRAKWLKAYEALGRSKVGAEQCGPLLGHYDQINGVCSNLVVVPVGLPELPGMPRINKETLPEISGKLAARIELRKASS